MGIQTRPNRPHATDADRSAWEAMGVRPPGKESPLTIEGDLAMQAVRQSDRSHSKSCIAAMHRGDQVVCGFQSCAVCANAR